MVFRIKDLMITVLPEADIELEKRVAVLLGQGGACGATGCGTTSTPDCGPTGCGTTSTPDCGATGCGTTSTPDCGPTGCGTTSTPDCGPTGCGTTSTPDCGPTGCGTTSTPDCGPTGCGTTSSATDFAFTDGCIASIDERTIFTTDPDELKRLQIDLRRLLEATNLQEHVIARGQAELLTGEQIAGLPTSQVELAAIEVRLEDALAEVRARRTGNG
jgi:hypothetical protein